MKLPICVLALCVTGCAAVKPSSAGPTLDWRPATAPVGPRVESPVDPLAKSPVDPMVKPPSDSSVNPPVDPLADARQSEDSYRAFQTHPAAQAPSTSAPTSSRPMWDTGQLLMQGFLGVSFYDKVTREGGNTSDVDGDAGDLDQLPLIGGGAEFKLGGERIDYGFDLMFSLEGRANAAAFAAGGGGAVIAVDVDLLIIDFYGGPFVSMFLGDKMRVYAGAGPLLQFADYHQDFNTTHASGSGFGVGWYARTGLEFVLPSRTMIGFGALWLDSSVDLDSGLGDLNVEGFQAVFTVTQGL
jgi:hypothetical protein